MDVKKYRIPINIFLGLILTSAIFASFVLVDVTNLKIKFLASSGDVIDNCGDGIVQEDLGEECDDKNLADGDGCSSDCKIQNTKLLELLFNEGKGTILNDSSGLQNNATISGASWVKLPTGKWVLSFNGTGNNASCNYSPSLDISGTKAKITLEAWVSLSQYKTGWWMGTEAMKWNPSEIDAGGYGLYYFCCPPGEVTGYMDVSGVWKGFAYEQTVLETNHWYHVVYTYDGQYGKTYLDGILSRTSEEWLGGIFPSPSETPFRVFNGFPGMIGKIAVYNYVLSPDQIQSNYKTELESYHQISSGQTIYVYPTITNNIVFPDTVLPNKYISNNISVDGSPGEYRSASFVIRPSENITSVTATISNLTGSGGTINNNAVDIRVVKTWYQAGIAVTETKNKILTPELLLKDDSLIKVENDENYLKLTSGNYVWISNDEKKTGSTIIKVGDMPVQDSGTLLPVDIPATINKQFWITIKIPDTVNAGTYNGTIQLNSSSGKIGTLQLELKVLPIRLKTPILDYSLFYNGRLDNNWPEGSISSEFKSETQMRAELKNMFNHGVNNPTVFQGSASPNPDKTWYTPYQESYSESDEKLLDKVLTMRKNAGMKGSLFFVALSHACCTGDLSKIKNMIKYLLNFISQYGINELYVYGHDEQSITSKDRTEIFAVHEAGGKVFNSEYVAGAADSAADILDLVNASGTPDASLAAKYHSYGHKIYSYNNPQSGIERPETYRRNFGLLLWQKDYDGTILWAYQTSFGSVWNDFDYSTWRDENFTYPTINGVIDTIQWEGFREGVNDVRYLSTLLDVIKKAKASGKNTSAAEAWVANLKNSNLANSNLDNVRSNMIDYILSLQDKISQDPIDTCTNECSQNGQVVCSDATHHKTCGQYDSDECLDWSSLSMCQGDVSCGYGDCTDDKRPSWGCKDGKCIYSCNADSTCESDGEKDNSVCESQCSDTSQKKCFDAINFQSCKDIDNDGCFEWTSQQTCEGSVVCGYGKCESNQRPIWSCDNGICAYDCEADSTCVKIIAYYNHYFKRCYNNDIYWYDSNGQIQEMYESCKDNVCSGSKCISRDSTEYCFSRLHCGDNLCNCGEKISSCYKDCESTGLQMSFYANNQEVGDWARDISLDPQQDLDLLLIVSNNTHVDIKNVVVKAIFPEGIAYQGDLKLDEVLFNGDIANGITIDLVPAQSEKRITFKGKVLSSVIKNTDLEFMTTIEAPDISLFSPISISIKNDATTLEKIQDWFLNHLIVSIIIMVAMFVAFSAILFVVV
jgi:cysteine-rich repeat protein